MKASTLFLGATAVCLILMLALMLAAWALHASGPLQEGQVRFLLDLTRNGLYPIMFIGLGALLWYLVRFYGGAYAKR